MRTIAERFGDSLDTDEFDKTEKLLSADCKYSIGDKTLIGPNAICESYMQNMQEGRRKLDALEWGKCKIESLNASEYIIHFTDYLTHKGMKYTHRCKQKVTVRADKIVEILHVDDREETTALNNFYKKVGLKN